MAEGLGLDLQQERALGPCGLQLHLDLDVSPGRLCQMAWCLQEQWYIVFCALNTQVTAQYGHHMVT